MRLALFCLTLVGMAYAQDSESNMSCVERLQMPLYPPLASQARISSSVSATAIVASDGSAQTKITGHPVLAEAAEKALRASTFRPACVGKSVRLVFNFVLDEDHDPGRLPQRVAFGYPNQFWISVAPQIMVSQP